MIEILPSVYYDKLTDTFYSTHFNRNQLFKPLSISLRVGERCNLACTTCLSESGSHKKYPWKSFKPLLRKISSLAPLRLVWTGGEPSLYPIKSDIYESINLGFYNVITTNLVKLIDIKDIVGSIVLNASIYGWDQQSYYKNTGRNYFDQFERNLRTVFDEGHLVCAALRIDNDWRKYLPFALAYIRKFAFRKLLLQNTLVIGRIKNGVRPILEEECQELRKYVESQELPFPTILPYTSNDLLTSYKGYISLEHLKNSNDIVINEGSTIEIGDDLIQELVFLSPENINLFTMQKYV